MYYICYDQANQLYLDQAHSLYGSVYKQTGRRDRTKASLPQLAAVSCRRRVDGTAWQLTTGQVSSLYESTYNESTRPWTWRRDRPS